MLAVMCSTPQRGKAQRKKGKRDEEKSFKRQRKVSVYPVCSLTYCILTEKKTCWTHMLIKSPFVTSKVYLLQLL